MNILGRAFSFTRNFRVMGRRRWRQLKFFNPQKQLPVYQQSLTRYSEVMLVQKQLGIAQTPYYNEELMNHLKRHLPGWQGFRAEFRTYVYGQWNPIYQDWDLSTVKLKIREEQPLLQRDRLMQIFESCPEGSYGYYAQTGLAPFKGLVGSFASATIDQFFASNVQFLKQQFSTDINEIMSTLETRYWNSRKELMDYIAGKSFTKGMRKAGVKVPSVLMTVWEGQRKPTLPDGEALEAEQLKEARSVLTEENLKKLDDAALARFTSELYDQLVAKQKAKAEAEDL